MWLLVLLFVPVSSHYYLNTSDQGKEKKHLFAFSASKPSISIVCRASLYLLWISCFENLFLFSVRVQKGQCVLFRTLTRNFVFNYVTSFFREGGTVCEFQKFRCSWSTLQLVFVFSARQIFILIFTDVSIVRLTTCIIYKFIHCDCKVSVFIKTQFI